MSFPFQNITHLRLSDSTMRSAHSCWRKLEFSKFYGNHGFEDSTAAACGRALHAGFQNYLHTKSKDSAVYSMLKEYPVNIEPIPRPLQVRSLEACYATLYSMFQHNILGSSELATVMVDGVEQPAIEVPFRINFYDHKNSPLSVFTDRMVPIFYVGFIDYIIYDLVTDTYIVIDIKTHRNNAHDLTAAYEFADQCLPYGLILERILGKQISEYQVKYLSVYIDLEFPTVNLYPVKKTLADVQDWVRGIYYDIQQIRLFASMNWFPRNGSACMNFKKTCPHFSLCKSRDEETITAMLGTRAKEHEINPWIELDLVVNPK